MMRRRSRKSRRADVGRSVADWAGWVIDWRRGTPAFDQTEIGTRGRRVVFVPVEDVDGL